MMLSRHDLRLPWTDRRFDGPAAIIAAWTVIATVAVIQAIALVRLDGRADLLRAIVGRVSIIPVWALATPLILRSARRFPVFAEQRAIGAANVAAHVLLGSLFVVLSNLVIRVPAAFGDGAGAGLDGLVRSTMQGVAEFYPPALVVYGVIVAIGHWVYRPAKLDPPPALIVAPLPPPGAASDAPVSPAPEQTMAPNPAPIDGHITVRQWNRVHLVRIEEIDFVEAEDNYVVVHAASKAYKGRERISDVESQLDSRRFVRIHRSTIVHIAKIREVQPLTHGDHAVVLRDGKVLRVARSRRQALEQALGFEL